jgi:hypothetical protein
MKDKALLLEGVILTAAAILSAIVIHELGHAAAAAALGVRVIGIHFIPQYINGEFQSYVTLDPSNLSTSKYVIISIAGSAIQFTVGVALMVLTRKRTIWPVVLAIPSSAFFGAYGDYVIINTVLRAGFDPGLIKLVCFVAGACFYGFFLLVSYFGWFGFRGMGTVLS